MAKFAALMLWTDAWIADTNHLHFSKRGLYHDLLVLMWRTPGCSVPNDNQWLAERLRLTPEEVVGVLRPIIAEFCQNDGNRICQKRLRAEFEWSEKKSLAQSVRAKARWEKEKDVCQRNATARNATARNATVTVTVPLKKDIDIEADASISPPTGKPRFAYPEEFEAFWQQCPRKSGKDAAHKVWVGVLQSGKATNEELIAGMMRHAADPNRDPTYTKEPARWLRGGHHTDGPLPPRGQGNGHARTGGDKSHSIKATFDDIFSRLESGDEPSVVPFKTNPRLLPDR